MQDPQPNLPSALAPNLNRQVLEHVADTFAHFDLSDVMRGAVKALRDVELFYPDWPRYHYVVASTKHVIFGFAIEMNTIAFRLDYHLRELALATGGIAFPECGEDWVAFLPGREDWPSINFEYWALKAYDYARQLGD